MLSRLHALRRFEDSTLGLGEVGPEPHCCPPTFAGFEHVAPAVDRTYEQGLQKSQLLDRPGKLANVPYFPTRVVRVPDDAIQVDHLRRYLRSHDWLSSYWICRFCYYCVLYAMLGVICLLSV